MRVPKAVAGHALTAVTLFTIFASQASPEIAFGPFFLLICAFSAWFVGNQFALLLSLFIATVQILNGHATIFHEGPLILTLKFLSALAVVLMLGVARAALEIEWQYARVDPLTGALNRKAFFEAIKDDAGHKSLTALVYADVDGLKRLNDRLGHDAGDKALINLANRVRKTLRRNDIFARIGGDEFVILLKVRDIAAVKLVAQRLTAALNADPLDAEGNLSCSLGVLILPTGSRSIDAELKQADTLMYNAKTACTGLMMAVSVKGGLQELIPSTPSANFAGQRRAAVRREQRETRLANGDSSASVAA